MAHLTRNDISHLTLHPKDIILNSSGQVKILAAELSEFQFDFNFKPGFYYSPEILKVLKNHNPVPQGQYNKPAVFTLGMSILSTCLTEDLSHLYLDDLTIDAAALTAKLNKIENCEIKEVLGKMLKMAPYDRISFP